MVDGTITDGPSQSLPFDLGGVAGGDTLVKALEECRRRSDIRAVVLRVNSPGGSAFSSDAVARAITRLRAAGKPVVTSMGDVAASGGYYIAAPTDEMFAQPSTTTGSIGVFAFKLDLARLLAMLSLNVEVLRRGPHADQQAPYRPWTPEEREIAERRMRHMYEMFVETVASGRQSRGLTAAKVDEVGRGHVWTGAQARMHGLVDGFGGVIAALDRAASLGRVPLRFDEEPDLVVLPRSSKTILQTLADLDAAQGVSATAGRRRHRPHPRGRAQARPFGAPAARRGASGRPYLLVPAKASRPASPSTSTSASRLGSAAPLPTGRVGWGRLAAGRPPSDGFAIHGDLGRPQPRRTAEQSSRPREPAPSPHPRSLCPFVPPRAPT